MKRMLLQMMKPRGRQSGWDWAVWILTWIVLLPLMVLMLILVPIILLVMGLRSWLRLKKYPNQVTVMGVMVRENQGWRLIAWQQITRIQTFWSEKKESAVVDLNNGESLTLEGIDLKALKAQAVRFAIPFEESQVVDVV